MNNKNSELIKQFNNNNNKNNNNKNNNVIANSDDSHNIDDNLSDCKLVNLNDINKNFTSSPPPQYTDLEIEPPLPPPSGPVPESVEVLESENENETPLDSHPHEQQQQQIPGLKINNSTNPDQVKLLGSKALAGISEFPKQTYNISKRKGGQFTMMLVGKSGVGKTSFINTLLNANVISDHMNIYRTQIPQKTTSICIHKLKLEEGDYNMDLNIIDTPGYGDLIDNRFCWYGPAKYIDDQFRLVIRQELQPLRENLKHTEVNLCLYFLNYSSRGLNALDLQAIKKLAERVNLIPIILDLKFHFQL
ncbi:hypothetical protein B5S31_g4074 [[Candida] boidinii]|nr:hypothetical protein B5S31_g4074 [[Candida] boidinii]